MLVYLVLCIYIIYIYSTHCCVCSMWCEKVDCVNNRLLCPTLFLAVHILSAGRLMADRVTRGSDVFTVSLCRLEAEREHYLFLVDQAYDFFLAVQGQCTLPDRLSLQMQDWFLLLEEVCSFVTVITDTVLS